MMMNLTALHEVIAPRGHSILALDAPITTAADALKWAQYLDFVSAPLEQRDAILVVPFADIAAAETFAAYAPVKSSYRFVAVCYHGAIGQEPELAACCAAVLADSADPALPFNGVNLTGLAPVAPEFALTKTRIEAALHRGVCVIQTGADGVPEVVRAITTYQQTPDGASDDLLLDVNAPLVLAYVRKAMRGVAKREPRRKNTIASRRNLQSAFLAEALKLDRAEILQNVEARKKDLVVVEDANDRSRVNARIPADWVRGMHVVAVTLDVY